MVEDIHDVTEEEHGDTLLALHLGYHSLPIVPIYLGSERSREALRGAGIDRLTLYHNPVLGVLAPDEIRLYVKQTLEKCGILHTPDDRDGLAAEIVERSGGWPQHLHCETAALFGELMRTDGNLAAVDREEVRKRAASYQEDSSDRYQSRELNTTGSLVAAVLECIPDTGLPLPYVCDVIEKMACPEGPASWQIPAGMSSFDLWEHLNHCGVLHEREHHIYCCPVPGLRAWFSGLASREAAASSDSR